MSDQQETGYGVILDLEGLFLSREFGRRPARLHSTAPASVASEPAQLEQVFLSDAFGRPEVEAAVGGATETFVRAASRRPALVLLNGGAHGHERETAQRRAVAAVSGVAAAALAVAGLTSGAGHGPGAGGPGPTEQAQGVPGASGTPLPGSGATVSPIPSSTGTRAVSGVGATIAQLTSFSPTGAVVPNGAARAGTPTPTRGSGGGGMLSPAITVVGNEISGVGSSLTSTSGDLGQAHTVAPVVRAVVTVTTSALDNLGGGSPPTILAGGLKE